MTSSIPSRFVVLRCSAAVFAFATCFATPLGCRAEEAGCEPPHHREQPAAGHWTGYHRLIYELVIPNMPPTMKITIKWEGEVSYDLGRVEEDDKPAIPPETPVRRRPLGVKPPEGTLPPSLFTDCCNDDQAAAILNAVEKHEVENSAKVQEILKWYAEHLPPQHLYVKPGENAVIKGTGKAGIQTPWGGTLSGGVTMSGTGQSTQPVEYDLKGEEKDPEVGFTEIEIIGVTGQMNFSGSQMVTGPGGWARGTIQVDQGGVRGHAHAESRTGGSGDVDYAHANPVKPTEKTRIAALKVEATKCWLMSGTVDSTTIRDMIRSSVNGMDIKVTESEWMATLDERDPDFERQVEQLAAEPIPAKLDWAYIDNFKNRWIALRGDGRLMSDYKRCVLKKLEEKFIKINFAALKVYVDNFPKVSQAATCGVMHAALERILPIVRLLQLYGVADCPLMDKVWEVASKEMQLLLKQTLARKYTMSDLQCFIGAYKSGLLDLGDQEAEFQVAWSAMEQAAADARAKMKSTLINPR